MNEIDEKILNEGIRLPLVIKKINTDEKDGGYTGKVQWFENSLAQVKQLMGTENKVVYLAVLVKLEDIEQPEKRQPGRPVGSGKKQAEEE